MMRCTTEHDGEIKATCLYLNRGASTKPGAIHSHVLTDLRFGTM